MHRSLRLLSLAACAALIVAAAPASAPLLQPDKLVILSLTDTKGKTSPCGCHTPKGGMARQASFRDSIRMEYGQVMMVDNGGFFPEQDKYQATARFMMDGMVLLGFDAVGVGDRDLRYGLAFLKENARETKLPLTSANLYMKTANKPAVTPYLIKQVGTVKVGAFSLISDKVDLGPSRDSLVVKDPVTYAQKSVTELRAKGATVIVLLSQLGKVESEDLVAGVDGIDAVIVGRNVPLLPRGRLIKQTVACYGGEQGQYFGRTVMTLDAKRKMTSGDNETFILSADVGENASVLQMVKAFEDKRNEEERKAQQEKELAKASETAKAGGGETSDRFLGAEVCARCHTTEFAQWKGTPHAQAWETLVDIKKDATPDCVPCHVVGYKKPGGFDTGTSTPHLVDVQCENCHGMGTQHVSFGTAPAKVTKETCMGCHTNETSPTFDFALYQPHVVHKPVADLKPIPQSPVQKMKMMKSGGK